MADLKEGDVVRFARDNDPYLSRSIRDYLKEDRYTVARVEKSGDVHIGGYILHRDSVAIACGRPTDKRLLLLIEGGK